MAITASSLRNNVYRLLDQVAETGRPLTVRRKGRTIRILRDEPGGRLAALPRRACIKGNPESLVHLDWSEECRHDLP